MSSSRGLTRFIPFVKKTASHPRSPWADFNALPVLDGVPAAFFQHAIPRGQGGFPASGGKGKGEVMPIYEFRCTKCGHIREFIMTGSDREIDMKCEECGGDDLERVMSSVNYAMGSSGSSSGRDTSPSATTRTCAPGKSCTTLKLPGHTK